MDCSTSQGLMLEFVEGTLPATLSNAVKRHIEGCPYCLQELERQSSRTRALQKLGRVPAPDQWDEIARSIRRTGWSYFARRYGLPAGIFGVIAALLVMAFLSIMRAEAPAIQAAESAAPAAADGSVPAEPADATGAPQDLTAGGADVARIPDATPSVVLADGIMTGSTSRAGLFDRLEADHYGRMVGQFLGEGGPLVTAADGAAN